MSFCITNRVSCTTAKMENETTPCDSLYLYFKAKQASYISEYFHLFLQNGAGYSENSPNTVRKLSENSFPHLSTNWILLLSTHGRDTPVLIFHPHAFLTIRLNLEVVALDVSSRALHSLLLSPASSSPASMPKAPRHAGPSSSSTGGSNIYIKQCKEKAY